MKKSKRMVLFVLAMIATTIALGGQGIALASSSYATPLGAPVSAADTWMNATSRVAVTIDPGSLSDGVTSSVSLRLPTDVYTTFQGNPNPDGSISLNDIPNSVTNSVYSVKLTPVGPAKTYTNKSVTVNTYNQWRLDVTGNSNVANNGFFYLDLQNTYIPQVKGNIPLTVDAPSGSPLTSANITVAQVANKKVDVTIDQENSLAMGNNDVIPTIRVKENQAGSLSSTGDQIDLTLPSGFKWILPTNSNVFLVSGDNRVLPNSFALSPDGTVLKILGTGTFSNEPTYYTLTGLSVNVDGTNAPGDVHASVTVGSDSYDLIVGYYGDYSTSVSINNPVKVIAGRSNQGINNGSITISEGANGSLIQGRTIRFTLSGNAKWNPGNYPVIDTDASDLNGLQLSPFTMDSVDGTSIQATVLQASSGNHKGAKIIFKNGGLDFAADQKSQPITLTLGGNAGASGQGTIANMVSPITASVNGSVSTLKSALQAQSLSPIDITENTTGAIDANTVTLTFPTGVTVNKPNSIKVTSGDLAIDSSNITVSRNQLSIPISSVSSKVSTIEISGLTVDVDGTVPDGSFNVDIGGGALVESTASYPNVTKVTSLQVANVGAETKDETKSAAFSPGKLTYTVNGFEKPLDVPPYLNRDGRLMMPARAVANAVGIADDNIIWDNKTQTVTIFKGDRVISFTVGEAEYRLNGISIPMDTRTEMVAGRNMVPFRYLAQALGAKVTWDGATRTAFLNTRA